MTTAQRQKAWYHCLRAYGKPWDGMWAIRLVRLCSPASHIESVCLAYEEVRPSLQALVRYSQKLERRCWVETAIASVMIALTGCRMLPVRLARPPEQTWTRETLCSALSSLPAPTSAGHRMCRRHLAFLIMSGLGPGEIRHLNPSQFKLTQT